MSNSSENSKNFNHSESSERSKKSTQMRTARGAVNPLLPLVAVGVIAIAAIGVLPRVQNSLELNRIHQQLETRVPELNAVLVKEASRNAELVLPGDLQPIQNIPIFARANGYLAKRFVDIGDIVKAGEVLAIIETPELDQQVQQAAANLRVAQANLTTALSDRENFAALLFAADSTIKQTRTNLEFSTTELKRFQDLATQGAVSFEQRDSALKQFNSDTASIEVAQRNRQAQLAQVASANARIAAAKQSVESNQANLQQLQALQGFQKVVAPSDGVITNRFLDAGALIAAGGSTGTTQILAMARTDVLRIFVDVPQSDYRQIHTNDRADLVLQEFPGQSFIGTVTNIAGSLNSNSRTLQTEIRIDNKDHVLKPGSYAEVHFQYVNSNPHVIIPSNASITKNDGLYVALVQNNKIQYRPIEVARDYGNKLEVSKGLKANEVVVVDPPDGLASGATVKTNVVHI
jgi:RND family efflux transporter MFP subunit